MNDIAVRLQSVRATIPLEVTLVAVSKYHTSEDILEAYDCGQRDFGESHAQQLVAKAQMLPKDIRWHFIGHLQTNKVKMVVPYAHLIHAVDSWHLLTEIEKHAARLGRIVDVLLQLHVAQEETKFGLTPKECKEMLATQPWKTLTHVRIRGMMAMATNTDDDEQIGKEFETVHAFFEEMRDKYFSDDPTFSLCSYGMSDDYRIALHHGTNIVRIGTAIFGPRKM